uniref:Uncharacterized protein n=1 Tax=Rhizophora mucronata TaxID=61149 RepID=A0A2P2LVD7_RHIMU
MKAVSPLSVGDPNRSGLVGMMEQSPCEADAPGRAWVWWMAAVGDLTRTGWFTHVCLVRGDVREEPTHGGWLPTATPFK